MTAVDKLEFVVEEWASLGDIVVRKSFSNEIAQVKDLFERIFVGTVFGHTPAFEVATDSEQIYVALLDDKIVGFASVWEPDQFVHYLCVSPDARHKKVGSTIVSSLVAIYGVPLTLKCLTKNKDGIAFYLATGWKKIEDGISDDGAYVLLGYPVGEERM